MNKLPGNKQDIHVFDVDGTLTHRDSFLLLLKYAVPSLPNRIAIWLSLVKMAGQVIVQRQLWPVKERLLAQIWQGRTRQAITAECISFFQHQMKADIRQTALVYLADLRKKNPGVQLVLLSASCREWLQPLADFIGADLICTELAYDKLDIFSGQFATPNCKGKEKRRRLLQKYPLEHYNFFCYGNSQSDKELQSISKQFFYRYF